MARIFISYSRADRQFIDQFVPLIRRVYGNDSVWFDDDIHGGVDWWQMILDEIAACDIFVYLISNESLESPYCLAELQEALRLKKQILPVIVRRLKQEYPGNIDDGLATILRRTQYVDMSGGFRDPTTIATLYAALTHLLSAIPPHPAKPITPAPTPEPPVPDKKKLDPTIRAAYIGGAFVSIAAIIAGILGLWQGIFANTNLPNSSPTNAVAQMTPDATLTLDAMVANILATNAAEETLTATAFTATPTATETPDLTLTANAQATEAAVIAAVLLATQRAQLTANAPTNTAEPTATFTLTPSLTHTPTITATNTPDLASTAAAATQAHLAALATLDVQNTRSAAIATSAYATAHAVATADAIATKQVEPTPTATDTNTPDPLAAAFTPVTTNADWTPVERDFNGVTMVLVPPGCFTLGSEQGDSDEKPIGQQCIDNYFWLDQTEVTMGQFERLGGYKYLATAYYTEDFPVRDISWEEARSFCINRRGGRLPSELEWEYAAKGPDNLVFPWGDNWNQHNAVLNRVSVSTRGYTVYHGPENVSSIPKNLSWIGAYDMSGNVWEWTNSIYKPYPYLISDGRETWTSEDRRVVRGGSWLSSSGAFLRTTNRRNDHPQFSSNEIGFRCARSYESP